MLSDIASPRPSPCPPSDERDHGSDPRSPMPPTLPPTGPSGRNRVRGRPLLDPPIVRRAIHDACVKLNPRHMMRNPVMFVVEVGSAYTTLLLLEHVYRGDADVGFVFQVTLWLWFTVLFANFAEAMAEGRGKAQADTLRKTRTETVAKKRVNQHVEQVNASALRKGDVVVCEPGDIIPGDGEVIEGIASVDESAITGESAPVIRESGGDRSAVTGGTRVLSDWIKVRITSNPGETFLDRMIALVEGAERQKTPNEIALDILLAGLTIVFMLAVATLLPYSLHAVNVAQAGLPPSITALISLLVCLIPTTIGGLLSAIGIAGMDRVMQHNVLAMSGARRGSRGGREHAPARQDGNHHPGKPPRRGIPSGPGGSARLTWPTRPNWPALPTRPPRAGA